MEINFLIQTYLKTLIPIFGKFTNGYYDVNGVLWLNRIIGICEHSRWQNIVKEGSWVNFPQQYSVITKLPHWNKIWW